ncbi:DoxX family protein [Aphanothece hegewaldii CCALA 016]|uniref:DoxX family protein n=1 Tax=Aphanothece hegewaldii CCALA 016 TaxID=2107694 RepID=A0A2T1LYL1_9CHRO|nr:DoxX family protein [Aphanothece hegewaldii]PSF37492.1 DoxX family protein [Aphanothece hegewaldii CCALA 016]
MEQFIPLLARILLSAIFIKSGIDHVLDPISTQQYMASVGLPFPSLLLAATILILIVGGFSILLGYQARWGALILIGFLIPATLVFHTDFPKEEISFFKNLALMGGLFMIIAYGAGSYSVDALNSLSRETKKRIRR